MSQTPVLPEQLEFDFSEADKANNVQPLVRAWPRYEDRVKPLVHDLEKAASRRNLHEMRTLLTRIYDTHMEIYTEVNKQVFER